jgi:hypothetical protein
MAAISFAGEAVIERSSREANEDEELLNVDTRLSNLHAAPSPIRK